MVFEDGLKEGKTPYSIGKELSAWLEKLFEAKIPAETIRSKARRHQKKEGGQMTTPNVTTENKMEIPKKQEYQPDKQPGPGRKPKHRKKPAKQPEPKTETVSVSKPGLPQYAAIISEASYPLRNPTGR